MTEQDPEGCKVFWNFLSCNPLFSNVAK
jgi:hypothetical protein